MSSIIKFQVISGAMDENPLCYLLQLDEYTFLLDCGWDDNFSLATIEEYKKIIKAVDGVLLTYPDIQHIGALPYLVGKCGLNCPIYATIPVIKMGQMFLYDLYLSHTDVENFDLFTLDDIDLAFDKIHQLKYYQSVNLKDKGLGLQITPLQAGHVIGGTFWKILKEGEEEIIYAVDFNHQKERHLNSCVIDTISKPALLITDSYSLSLSQQQLQQKRRVRDEKLLLDSALKALRNNGDVLMCTDTAGRVLELVHLLDQMWKREDTGLLAYSIAWLNHVSISVAGFAKSQVEWMNDKIVRSFEEVRYNPFQFKHVKVCSTLDEVYAIQGPKLIIASTSDMEYGFSRELFLRMCSYENNLILFTMRANYGTLARRLIDNPDEKQIQIEVKRKVRLEGKELDEYYRQQHEKELEKQMRNKKSKELEAIDGDVSSTDDEDDEDGAADDGVANGAGGGGSNTGKHDIMKLQRANKKQGFFRYTRKNYLMFPYKEDVVKWDDYGQSVKIEDYTTHMYDQSNYYGTEMPTDSMNVNVKVEELGGQHDQKNQKDDMVIPTKSHVETCTLNVRAKIVYVDFDGRSDGESVKKIIGNIKPKNLIIIHGTQKATMELAEYCRKAQIVQDKIFTPAVGDIVDATSETQMYQIKLNDNVINNIKFEKSKDYELAWIDGLIKARNLQQDKQIIQMPGILAKSLNLDFNLESLNKDSLVNIQQRKCVFINEPKLSDLKQIFVKLGFNAEFHGGVLVCNNLIALRKNETGRIILEGVVCEDYYKIRNILYNEYAII